MNRTLRHILATIVCIASSCFTSLAQEVETTEELNYRDFKFYREEEDISLWGGLDKNEDDERSTYKYTPNSRYALSYATNKYRGYDYSEMRNSFGNMGIDYATARSLKALGFRGTTEQGSSGSLASGGLAESTTIATGKELTLYDGHSIRMDISGRDYLAGATYRGIYSLPTKGVMLKEGWTLMTHARGRTGRDLYVEGVYTNALDLSFGTSYSGRNNDIHIALIIPYSERGLRGASTQEAYTLTSNNLYNPTWGIQNGGVRNSRVATTLRPEAVALWHHRVTAMTRLTLSANLYYELRGNSALTWFNAPTPAPDNYKYMPSYQRLDSDRHIVEEAWLTNDLRYTQIDWDRLYHTNTIQQDGHARYAVASRHSNTAHLAINAGFNTLLNGATVDYGIELRGNSEHKYRVLDDLLGASHIIDKDYYLEDDATYSHLTENNLQNPNNRVIEGGRYGYDYSLARLYAKLYASARWQLWGANFEVAANMAMEHTQRHGNFEKELFAGSASYGRSRSINLTPALLAAKCSYNAGKHDMGIALKIRSESPRPDDLFLQTEYNNRIIDNPTLATAVAGEISYTYTAPRLRLNAQLYLSHIAGETDVVHYYDDLAGEYADAVVSGIARLNIGMEALAYAKWSQYFSSSFAVSAGYYRYNPTVTTYSDNDNTLISNTKSNMKGRNTGAPELTVYGDITFRYNGWMARASVNYWGMRYATPSHIRRTERIVSYAASKEETDVLKSQQRLPDATTMDITLSKRIKLHNNTTLNIQLSARNILGSNVIYSSYEENRISRHKVGNRTDIAPFANRMTYAYPRLLSLSASLWF